MAGFRDRADAQEFKRMVDWEWRQWSDSIGHVSAAEMLA